MTAAGRLRIHVLGAGIVGLACADELLRRGHDVVIVDPAPGSGASYAAAGMLSPSGEAWWGEPDLHRLGVASARLWPGYAERLGVPLAPTGTLLVGHDAGDLAQVRRQAELLAGLGARVDELTGAEARLREPSLGRVSGGAWLPDDHSVDPRLVIAALLRLVGDRLVGSLPAEAPDALVVATGARLPDEWSHLVRPVQGEILRLRCPDGVSGPRRVLRGSVSGEPVYVVPRHDWTGAPTGEVVVGATSEEYDGAPRVTAGGVLRLLAAGRLLVPGLDRAELVEALARSRPATPDHLPLVGPAPASSSATPRGAVWLAAGHYRHGVLLAPLAARMLADQLEGAEPDPALDPRRTAARTPTEDDR